MKTGKRSQKDVLQQIDDLYFIKRGHLNMIILKPKKDGETTHVGANDKEFLEDPAFVKSTTIDRKSFVPNCVFKVTLEFAEQMACIPETSVRETTDWVLCSCSGASALYSVIEDRLVLHQCAVCIQSSIPELRYPISMTLRFDDSQWVVESVFR